ncbi:PepSY domain-containing protein [Nonomuraea sp. SBT364]|uniref:PepSY domain-containing protein n=1 Tax=Nonomuraea sp. SBT364 TaxID=1580530 RepID=UPI00066C49E7|nr:PepSY domain-containing protein [Nonomuraea sp. SBT364]
MNGETKRNTIIGATLASAALLTGTGCGPAAPDATGAAQAAGAPAAEPTDPEAPPTDPEGPPTDSEMSPTEPEASPPDATPSPTDGSPSPGATQGGIADLKKAGDAALAAVPNSTLISIESEEDGKIWEVQVVDGQGAEQQMDIDATTGQVVNGPTAEESDAEDKAKHLERVKAAKLSYAQAADKIAASVPEGRITELNLDSSKDKTVWESDVVTPDGTKHEVTVDAASGEVTKSGSTS